MYYNSKEQKIYFSKNGKKLGSLYGDRKIPKKKYRLAITTCTKGNKIELLSFRRTQEKLYDI